MTEAQFWNFINKLWPAACAGQGWDKLPSAEREDKRHEVLAALGFGSLKHVDKRKGFDRVVERLEELAKAVIVIGPDQGEPVVEGEAAGERRRLLHRVGETATELSQAGYPEHSLMTILRDFGVVPGVRDITGLPGDALLTLSRTLTARLADWSENQTVNSE